MCSSAALFFAIKAKGQENPSSLRLDSLILINGWSLSAGKDSDFLKSESTSAEHLLYTMWLISNDFVDKMKPLQTILIDSLLISNFVELINHKRLFILDKLINLK